MPASVHIETTGCAFNVSDSEALAGVLLEAGYDIAPDAASADVLVLNACTVKDRTFLDFRRRLDEASAVFAPVGQKAPPRVVLAGCVPKAHERAATFDGFSAIGPDSIARAPEVVAATLRGEVARDLGRGEATRPRLELPSIRRNPVVEILPVARGCMSACTFCQTRLARGRLESFPAAALLERARRAVGEGARFLWVTGQDVGAWGRDSGGLLPDVLGAIADLDGDFSVRVGMTSPRWIAEDLAAWLDLLARPRVFEFLHVPVQSGSERVVSAMRRDGSVEQFRRVAEAFARRFPDGTLTTDLIVGYPEETDADFDETLRLVDELRLGFVNASRFSARPGTAAARLPPLPGATTKERSRRLAERVRAVGAERLKADVGRTTTVRVESASEDGTGRLARTRGYRAVAIAASDAPLGTTLRVELADAVPFHYSGRILRA